MSIEKNLQIIDALNDAFNSQDWKRMIEMLADSVIFTHPAFLTPQVGISIFYPGGAVRQYFEQAILTTPDYHLEKLRSFSQNNWICWMGFSVGTYLGASKSISHLKNPQINAAYRVPGCIVYKVENDKVTEIHNYFDRLNLLTQLDESLPPNQEELGFFI